MTGRLLSTLLAVLDPGDQVIIFEPFCENHGPGCSSFYANPELGRTRIRFCFPKTDGVLREAGERLQKLRAL